MGIASFKRAALLCSSAAIPLIAFNPSAINLFGLKASAYENSYSNGASQDDRATALEGIERSSVRILGALEGSGVIVNSKNGTYSVLTAWHVIAPNRKGEQITIQTHKGNYQTSIEQSERIGNLDMATISFRSDKLYEIASISSNKVKSKSVIYVAGYPNSRGVFTRSSGTLVANADVGIDQGYQLLYSNWTADGMSGGPIFDLDLNLVGIHGRGERSQSASATAGSKTNINQGIPISYYLQYRSGVPIKASSVNPNTWSDYYALLSSYRDGAEKELGQNIDLNQTRIRFLNQMIRLKPKGSFAYLIKSVIRNEMDPSVPQQNNDFQKAIALNTEYLEITKKARKLFALGRYEEALQQFMLADQYITEMGSENYMFKSAIYNSRGAYYKALDAASKGLALETDAYSEKRGAVTTQIESEVILSGLYTALGDAYLGLKDFDKAIASHNESVSWSKKYQLVSGSTVSRSSLLEDIGRSHKQIAYALIVGKKDLGNGCLSWSKATKYGLKNSRFDSLCQKYKPELSGGVKPVEPYQIVSSVKESNLLVARAQSLINARAYGQALPLLERAISLDPSFSRGYYLRGFVHGQFSDYRNCISDMSRSISLSPGFHSAFFDRAGCKEDIGDVDGAIADYSSALAIKPSTDIYTNVGLLYFDQYSGASQGSQKFFLQKAKNSYLKALEREPNNLNALYMSGRIHVLLGDKQTGCSYLRKASKLGDSLTIDLLAQLGKTGFKCN